MSHCLSYLLLMLVQYLAWSPLIVTKDIAFNDFCYYWDDGANFVNNPVINDPLSWSSIKSMLVIERLNVYEPLSWLLKGLVRHRLIPMKFLTSEFVAPDGVGGAFAQRRTTLLFHVLNSFILYHFILKILSIRNRWCLKPSKNSNGLSLLSLTPTSSPPPSTMVRFNDQLGAIVGASFWAVHPLRTEVIGWPSAQPYALATCFYLLGLLIHLSVWEELKSNNKNKFRLYFLRSLSWFLFLGGFLSKSAVLPYPGTLFAIALALSPPIWMIQWTHKEVTRDDDDDDVDWKQVTFSDQWIQHWKNAFFELILPIISFIMGVGGTLLANSKGVKVDADVHWLDFSQRLHKAMIVMVSYCGRIVNYMDLRQHYDIKLNQFNKLGTLPISLSSIFSTISSSFSINDRTSIGEEGEAMQESSLFIDYLFVIAPILFVIFIIMLIWNLSFGCWHDICLCKTFQSSKGTNDWNKDEQLDITKNRIKQRNQNINIEKVMFFYQDDDHCIFGGTCIRALTALCCHWLVMWLPVCGIVQHGMVQFGGDRYSYLPDLAFGCFVAGIISHLITFPEKKDNHINSINMLSKIRKQDKYNPNGYIKNRKVKEVSKQKDQKQDDLVSSTLSIFSVFQYGSWISMVILVGVGSVLMLGALSQKSRSLLPTWRNDETAFKHGLKIDPTDWRVLDTYAELLVREGRGEEAKPYLTAANSIWIGHDLTLKALLAVGKNHMFLGDADLACTMFNGAFDQRPDWVDSSPHLSNNVAVCAVRDAYNLVSSEAGHEKAHLILNQQSEKLHMKANSCFEKASKLVFQNDREQNVYETISETKSSVISNFNKFNVWKQNGGDYHGAVMW